VTGRRDTALVRWGVVLASAVASSARTAKARALEVVLEASRGEVTVREQFTVSVGSPRRRGAHTTG
jgi:hypothetical protein